MSKLTDSRRILFSIISGLVQTGVPMTPLAGTWLGYCLIATAGLLSVYIFMSWGTTKSFGAASAIPGQSLSVRVALLVPTLLLISMACVWSYFGGLPGQFSPHAPPIATWSYRPNQCSVSTDSAAFLKFQETYKIVAVCGIESPSVDRYEDRNISISEAFTIGSNQISILVPFNERTLQALQDRIALDKKAPSSGGELMGSHWGELILIPKSVTADNIKKLSDVPVYKGKILRPEDF
jgi:hypothetical protein